VFVFFLGRIQHAVLALVFGGVFSAEREGSHSPYCGDGMESEDPRSAAIEEKSRTKDKTARDSALHEAPEVCGR
jgi:hypothetical protein